MDFSLEKLIWDPGLVVQTYNSNIWETEAGRLQVQIQSGLHIETQFQQTKKKGKKEQKRKKELKN